MKTDKELIEYKKHFAIWDTSDIRGSSETKEGDKWAFLPHVIKVLSLKNKEIEELKDNYKDGYTEAISDLHRGFYEKWIEKEDGDFKLMAEDILKLNLQLQKAEQDKEEIFKIINEELRCSSSDLEVGETCEIEDCLNCSKKNDILRKIHLKQKTQ